MMPKEQCCVGKHNKSCGAGQWLWQESTNLKPAFASSPCSGNAMPSLTSEQLSKLMHDCLGDAIKGKALGSKDGQAGLELVKQLPSGAKLSSRVATVT